MSTDAISGRDPDAISSCDPETIGSHGRAASKDVVADLLARLDRADRGAVADLYGIPRVLTVALAQLLAVGDRAVRSEPGMPDRPGRTLSRPWPAFRLEQEVGEAIRLARITADADPEGVAQWVDRALQAANGFHGSQPSV